MKCCGIYKFLSGFFTSAALTDWYFYAHSMTLPFMGYTMTPHIAGIKAIIFGVVAVIFFYLGFLKRHDITCCHKDDSSCCHK